MKTSWGIKNLSKDLFDGLMNKAGQSKDVIVASLANEFSTFLKKINVSEELAKVLDNLTIEVDAKVHLKKGHASSGSKKVKISVK